MDFYNTKGLAGLRGVLLYYGFWNDSTVSEFVNLFQNQIDILKYEYCPDNSIMIKVKKTSMRKLSHFRHESFFYYPIVTSALRQLMISRKAEVVDILSKITPPEDSGDNPYSLYNKLIGMDYICSLVNVQCISGNTVQIIL